MKTKYIKWGDYHLLNCTICSDMEKRGYRSEWKYWDDFFEKKLRPIKYKLVKVPRKKKV